MTKSLETQVEVLKTEVINLKSRIEPLEKFKDNIIWYVAIIVLGAVALKHFGLL